MGEKSKIFPFEMFRGFIIKITLVSSSIFPEAKYYIEYEKDGKLLTTDVIFKTDKVSDILYKFNKSFVLLLENNLIEMFDYSSYTMDIIIMWLLSNWHAKISVCRV